MGGLGDEWFGHDRVSSVKDVCVCVCLRCILMGDIFLCWSPGMVLFHIVVLLIHSVDVVVYHSCSQRVSSQVNVVVWQTFSCEISTD